ncbi:Uncharacterised protein [uncultured archaeon]|nr:Uncharacterised protein [uncultured archaeon]
MMLLNMRLPELDESMYRPKEFELTKNPPVTLLLLVLDRYKP